MEIDTRLLEKILITLIVIILSLTYLNVAEEEEVIKDPIINQDSFEIFPLIAWKSTHKKWDGTEGDIVKIRYRVEKKNTKLWIYDVETERLVHEQSIIRDPWPDGRHRDFTYIWKLYKTERSQYIPSGEYKIVVGGKHPGGFGQLKTIITI